ncbi:DGF-1-like protein, putative [Bodo saltans]|uniref:DGF-1-like protein, putative n=1 Tax=Bodo saltans TaxID=75058 RepID=A0A0S4J8D2_BODSA|nr:DGF-1-like protein, putative [Bodo saltans]|eukprot:CUG87659.1 DGF-1-like protein, putative [Bodo saltans]
MNASVTNEGTLSGTQPNVTSSPTNAATMSFTESFTFNDTVSLPPTSTFALTRSHSPTPARSSSTSLSPSPTADPSTSLTISRLSLTKSFSNDITTSDSASESYNLSTTKPPSGTSAVTTSSTRSRPTSEMSMSKSLTKVSSLSGTATVSRGNITASSTWSNSNRSTSSFTVGVTESMPPSETVLVTQSSTQSMSRRSASVTNSSTHSSTRTSSHTVVSARITASLSCTTAPRVSIRTVAEDVFTTTTTTSINSTSSSSSPTLLPPSQPMISIDRCSSPPSETVLVTQSSTQSMSRRSASATNSSTHSSTRTSSHTVVSARITASLSCTTAPRVSIRTVAEDVFTTTTTSLNSSSSSSSPELLPPSQPMISIDRCSSTRKQVAEALFFNGTVTTTGLACFPVYASSLESTISYPSVRGPYASSSSSSPPPFLLAIAYELDANWQIHLLVNGSALLVPDDPDNTTVVNNATKLTTTSGTLYILLTSTPGWMSQTTIETESVCGFHRSLSTLTVQWPQQQISVIDQIFVGLVTGGSFLTGNPTAASALAMIALLSCSAGTPSAQSSGYFISFFFDVGPTAVGAGNVALVLGILALHFIVVRVWMLAKGVNEDTATADMRFPAASIFLAMFLLPGAAYGGAVAVSSDEGDIVDVVIGSVVLTIVFSLVVLSQVYLIRCVLPVSYFLPYPCEHPSSWAAERFAILPSARWVPEAAERRFTPLMGTRTKAWSTLSIADLLLALCLSTATGVSIGTKGSSCSFMPLIVAVFYLGNAAVIMALRPHRRPMDRLLFPVIWILLGTLCLMKYSDTATAVVDRTQTALSAVQFCQTVFAVWVFFRERQWRMAVEEAGIEENMPHDVEMNDIGISRSESAGGGALNLEQILLDGDFDDDDAIYNDIVLGGAVGNGTVAIVDPKLLGLNNKQQKYLSRGDEEDGVENFNHLWEHRGIVGNGMKGRDTVMKMENPLLSSTLIAAATSTMLQQRRRSNIHMNAGLQRSFGSPSLGGATTGSPFLMSSIGGDGNNNTLEDLMDGSVVTPPSSFDFRKRGAMRVDHHDDEAVVAGIAFSLPDDVDDDPLSAFAPRASSSLGSLTTTRSTTRRTTTTTTTVDEQFWSQEEEGSGGGRRAAVLVGKRTTRAETSTTTAAAGLLSVAVDPHQHEPRLGVQEEYHDDEGEEAAARPSPSHEGAVVIDIPSPSATRNVVARRGSER